jgi:hypothetical protein
MAARVEMESYRMLQVLDMKDNGLETEQMAEELCSLPTTIDMKEM